MRVLIADAFEQSGLDALGESGIEIDYRPHLQSADLADAVDAADVLIVRSTRVEADVFKKPGPLGLVIRAGAGTNTIDTAAAAAKRGICCQCSGKERGGSRRIGDGSDPRPRSTHRGQCR